MTTMTESATDVRGNDERRDTLAFAAIGLGATSIFAAIFAVGLSTRAATEARDALEEARSRPAAAATSASSNIVTLDEFTIDPGDLSVPAGSVLTVHNAGAVTHNLSVDGNASPMVDGADSTQLDISGLAPGTYEMRCDVPGHAEAGMTGSITVA